MLSHRYKTIFVHIPKCAGTTVEKYFMKLNVPRHSNCWPLPSLRNRNFAKTINLYPNYFTFTFVRNPYARFVSYCFFGLYCSKTKGWSVGYTNMQECLDLTAELLAIEAEGANPPDPEKRVGPRGIKLSSLQYTKYHCKPQVNFLLDQNPSRFIGVPRVNDAPCSFIGRQESFAEDFLRVLEILNVPKVSEKFEYVYRRKQQQHYSHYYDEATRRKVQELYARDLEVLGYEFEREGVVSVLNPLYDLREAREKRKEKIKLPRYQWAKIYYNRMLMYLRGVAKGRRRPKALLHNILQRLQQ